MGFQKLDTDGSLVWFDGSLIPFESATIHLMSHTLHYGTGAFEGIRAYEGKSTESCIFRLVEHVQRLQNSIHVLGFEMPWKTKEIADGCRQVVEVSGFTSCYIRPIAYLDETIRGLKVPDGTAVRIAIACWKWGQYMGKDALEKGIRIHTSTYRRGDVATSLSMAKATGNYLTSVLSRQEANRNGFDEAILLDQQGYVGEGSAENIFMVKNGKLFTPQIGAILPGITRDSVIQLARHFGIEVIEKMITRSELLLADEVFMTGTAVELNPVREIDRKVIGLGVRGPITEKLQAAYFEAVAGKLSEFRHWNTVVKVKQSAKKLAG